MGFLLRLAAVGAACCWLCRPACAWNAAQCCICGPNDVPGRCTACIPPGTSLFFSGDSLTRYQVLDLLYSLKHGGGGDGSLGEWAEREVNNPLAYDTWMPGALGADQREASMRGSHAELSPEEHACDCHPARSKADVEKEHFIENRYFRSEACDVNVSFMQVLHVHWVEGHLRGEYGSEPARPAAVRSVIPPPVKALEPFASLRWRMSWTEALREIVAKHHPHVLVVNQGAWHNTLSRNARFYEELRDAALDAVGPEGCAVWKTTTKARDRSTAKPDTRALKAFGDPDGRTAVFQAGKLTNALAPTNASYHDHVHFRPKTGVYRALNLALIRGLFPPADGGAASGAQLGGMGAPTMLPDRLKLRCPRGQAFPHPPKPLLRGGRQSK
ncbi:hypothetical protein KFE25_011301 [Diacronema lutheri]|uniref:SGNH domain-containing protein n=1 Tax=Diacronema lutheri TaxID=2081491 RepID=A0A8J6C3I6_DIALT|nr:hypothetical protein KFE25_011301 [Diacronema lutheri]